MRAYRLRQKELIKQNSHTVIKKRKTMGNAERCRAYRERRNEHFEQEVYKH